MSLYIHKGKYIVVATGNYLQGITEMVLKYYDTEEFSGMLININQDIDIQHLDAITSRYNIDRAIYYNLEHIGLRTLNINDISNYWTNERLNFIGNHYNEIWDFLIENTDTYPDTIKSKVIFKPLRHVDLPKIQRTDFRYDIIFHGIVDTDCRRDIVEVLTRTSDIRTCILTGVEIMNSLSELSQSKFAIDWPHYNVHHNTQNVVRILEYICTGCSVVSTLNLSSYINYFPNIVRIFDSCEGFYYRDVFQYIKETTPEDRSDQFKNLTENDKNYADYIQNIKQQYIHKINESK